MGWENMEWANDPEFSMTINTLIPQEVVNSTSIILPGMARLKRIEVPNSRMVSGLQRSNGDGQVKCVIFSNGPTWAVIWTALTLVDHATMGRGSSCLAP